LQRLAHPRKLVGRSVELYRGGPALGHTHDIRKQADGDFRHQIAFMVAEEWLLEIAHRTRTATPINTAGQPLVKLGLNSQANQCE
jgi:hypothetical protein